MNVSNDSVGLIIEYLNDTDRDIISLINKRLNKIELNTNYYYEKICDETKLKLLNNRYKNVHVAASSLEYLNDNKNIKSITFGFWFNQKIDNLPNTLTHLTFCGEFNQKIDNLPNTLTHLTFDWYSRFNQKTENLPNTLTHLTFGRKFNQKIENLPNTLTHLTFSGEFNQKIENLPNTLTHLTFGWYSDFNQKIYNLPNTLTYLKISPNYNKKLEVPYGCVIGKFKNIT
jgi:hypothetical protein